MDGKRTILWLVTAKRLDFSPGSTFYHFCRALRNFLASEIQRETAKTLGRGGQQAAELPNRTGKFI
jgi:hypothetical protein